ncbi:MAG: hypothetical protein R2690_10595 [Acidimicrobiales bacterium]
MNDRAPDVGEFELIDSDDALAKVVAEVADEPRYAIDTEFHRERTYFPALGLLQLAWPGRLVLVDAVAADVRALRPVFEGDGLAVFHAADQDLEVLEVAAGAAPSHIFDTQLAAGFLGMSTPSLSALHERELGLRLAKGDRLTDWLARPLTADQLRYAAPDVAWLLEVTDRLEASLRAKGRWQWAVDECVELRNRTRGARAPEDAWRRIKEARQLRGPAAAWLRRWPPGVRKRRPASTSRSGSSSRTSPSSPSPTDHRDEAALRKVRGIDGRHLRKGQAERLLGVIEQGRTAAPPPAREVDAQLDRTLRPAITLVSAWVSQLARDLDLDTALLATRHDIEDLLVEAPDARLRSGWRADLVGEPIRRLVGGDAALAFDGQGGLVLEDRVGRPPT